MVSSHSFFSDLNCIIILGFCKTGRFGRSPIRVKIIITHIILVSEIAAIADHGFWVIFLSVLKGAPVPRILNFFTVPDLDFQAGSLGTTNLKITRKLFEELLLYDILISNYK